MIKQAIKEFYEKAISKMKQQDKTRRLYHFFSRPKGDGNPGQAKIRVGQCSNAAILQQPTCQLLHTNNG